MISVERTHADRTSRSKKSFTLQCLHRMLPETSSGHLDLFVDAIQPLYSLRPASNVHNSILRKQHLAASDCLLSDTMLWFESYFKCASTHLVIDAALPSLRWQILLIRLQNLSLGQRALSFSCMYTDLRFPFVSYQELTFCQRFGKR